MHEERPDESVGLCDRCLKELYRGRGEFYEVDIHARVDSSPPILDSPNALSLEEIEAEWGKVIQQLESTPRVDAENQVESRRRLLMCSPCFQVWIDEPSGQN
ncbi:hypothetical protein [Roseiconus lacunae]|uniref:Uncharacterized protein n=1 Tax=Roseiconus lacunae TaxID=2605694 RepID=A0ABT7PNB1_9BACT|nr:hypothetical protein [Roseiconus lacunae]MCD0462081.1 hypothetical protein [Roseiconus lacunae]MDM4017972.1 hypothetical protein [Roseiconus lacunae]WRQ52455.1 hypothetical protein U8335_07890 [Stieleria sp. HD01]